MIGHQGVSTPGPFLCTTTPQPQCMDINISSSVYTDNEEGSQINNSKKEQNLL